MQRQPNRLPNILNSFNDQIFDPNPPRTGLFPRTFVVAALALLFVSGVLHWVVFFQYGEFSFSPRDWPKEFLHYATLRALVSDPVIPYFVTPARRGIEFLGNPETVLSPQIVLLPLMGIGKFVLVNTLIMYSLGFLGCLLIRWRYQLSLVPFIMLFLLFNFNGHITSHISAGHSMWNGYFLLPFFVYLILEMVRPSSSARLKVPLLMALVLFGIVLQGSFHIYFWCLMFLVLVGLFNRELWKEVMLAGIFSVWLSLFRLLPAAFAFTGFQPSYASGYPNFATFFDALTTIKAFQFEHLRNVLYDVSWWEHDAFIGYLGLAFVVFFGIYHRFSSDQSVQSHRFRALDLPILLFVLFSFGFWFDIISDLQIPLVSWVERVPSRFFIIPLVMLIVLSSIRMQALIHRIRDNVTAKVLLVAGILQLAHSLMAHSWFWRVDEAGGFVEVLPEFTFNPPGYEDLLYTTTVNVAAIMSTGALITLCVLFFWSVRSRQS